MVNAWCMYAACLHEVVQEHNAGVPPRAHVSNQLHDVVAERANAVDLFQVEQVGGYHAPPPEHLDVVEHLV